MQKNASQKCKKDAGAKTQCKKMQITGLICFLFAFFCIVVLPFFFCFCLVFFVFLCICLGFCNFFPKSCLSSWSLVWFAFFFLFFFAFCPGFSTFFRNHVCPVGPWSNLLFLLHVFACLFFAPFRVAFFNCVFSFFLEFVLFASPASALLICMFFALFLFFPSWKFTRQHNVYGVSFTKEERHEPPSSRQDTTKGGWELITFSTYKEPPDVDPISYIHIFLGPQPHNAHDPKKVSGCTGCK